MIKMVEFIIEPYPGGKSKVLRCNPPDFLDKYIEQLGSLGVKKNDNLLYPGTQTRGPGFILANFSEIRLKNFLKTLENIKVETPDINPSPKLTPVKSNEIQLSKSLQKLVSAKNKSNVAEIDYTDKNSLKSTFKEESPPKIILNDKNSLKSTVKEESSQKLIFNDNIPEGFQKVSYIVIKPSVGMTLYLITNNSKIPFKIINVTSNNEIVNECTCLFPDNQSTKIRLINDQWQIPKFAPSHSIIL